MALPVINQNLFMILRTFIAALLAGILMKYSVGANSTVNFSIVFLLELMCFIGITTTLNFLDKQYMKIATRNKTEVNH
jgi:hypothetical protein